MRTSKLEQVATYVILAVFTLFALFPIVGILLSSIAPAEDAIGGFSLLWALRWRAGGIATATPRRFWLVSAEIAAVGLCWAGLLLHLMPAVSAPQQLLLVGEAEVHRP